MRILLVEDDEDLAAWLGKALAQGGFLPDRAATAAAASQMLQDPGAYDVVVLDLGLPDRDGLALLTALRSRGMGTPVLVLTARGALPERVKSLNLGADDFLAKPFEVEELEARLAALVRRSRGRSDPKIAVGSLEYDPGSRSFTLAGELVALTPREHAALTALLLKAGTPVPKQQLHRKVFPADSEAGPEAIEQVLHRLRRKLQGADVQVVTVRGLGYILQAAPRQAG
jgi:two-component system response regulator TctD